MDRPRLPIVLVVIDGWGVAPAGKHNAISLAAPKNMDRLAKEFPSTLLEASAEHVGLPERQMGNSEVGHLNIGAGRIVDQDFVRINKVVTQNTLGKNPVFRGLFEHCKKGAGALHVMGLLGPGGVHAHERHLFGLLEAAREANVERVFVHHFLDGRDTPPKSGLGFAEAAQKRIAAIGTGKVATVSGRYWSMDRDKRWERTERAYRMLTRLEGEKAKDASDAIRVSYANGKTDEFVEPTVLAGAEAIGKRDAILAYNFRPDRMRQIVRALGDPGFKEFKTEDLSPRLVTMTQYDATFDRFGVKIAFPPDPPANTLGEAYATLGLRQLRIGETEKYAHVTYFFSGGREAPFPNEDRLLVPSPKVATYDLKPSMSANELTDALLERLRRTKYDLVVLNFANPDMVGHTGMLAPTIDACRVTDACIGRLADFCQTSGYLLAITADHGNAETMVDADGQPQTAHTTNPVPFIVVHESVRGTKLLRGGLSSVAPTLLDLVGLARPDEMTAPSLVDASAKT